MTTVNGFKYIILLLQKQTKNIVYHHQIKQTYMWQVETAEFCLINIQGDLISSDSKISFPS